MGAGFGGLAAAKELAKSGERVTIVDRHNYHTFQPLLYQVATAGLNAADVAYAVRGIFQGQSNVSFRQAEVTGVDWVRSTLELDDGELPFDHLIVAAGATAAYFGIEGAAENGFPLYVLSDAITLRNHKKEPIKVEVRENLFRWVNWEITKSTDKYVKQDYRTIHFTVDVPPDGEKKLTYTVKYSW